MPTLSLQNKTINYLDLGTGTPVVLLHPASPAGARQWRKVTEHLQPDFRVLAPDLWGFGESAEWDAVGPLTHDDQALLVEKLLREVAAASGEVHLVGHSYGGATALRFGVRNPELVLSMTLIEPLLMPLLVPAGRPDLFEAYKQMAKSFIADAERGGEDNAWRGFMEFWNGPGTWDAMPEKARTRMYTQTATGVSAMPGNISDPTEPAELHSLGMRCMVVCGDQTSEPHKHITRFLSQEIPGCLFREIHGAGHLSVLTHPEEVSRLILEAIA